MFWLRQSLRQRGAPIKVVRCGDKAAAPHRKRRHVPLRRRQKEPATRLVRKATA